MLHNKCKYIIVNKYISECKQYVVSKKENDIESSNVENKEVSKERQQSFSITEIKDVSETSSNNIINNKETPININSEHQQPKKEKLKDILEKELKPIEKEKSKRTEKSNDIIIEDSESKIKTNTSSNISNSATNNSQTNLSNDAQLINNINPSSLKETKEKLQNMVL